MCRLVSRTVPLALLLSLSNAALDFPQSGTDYSAHVSHVRNFVQDERSAQVDYKNCAWSKPFATGTMDCETYIEGSVVVGMECTETNCNKKRLRCCAVVGRFKKCDAIYNGFVALVDSSFNELWSGLVGAKTFGASGVSLTGLEQDLHHYFMVGIECNGKNCRNISLRMRRLFCQLDYVIENEASEMKGAQRSCEWTKWFSNDKRPPIPPPRPGESKTGSMMMCPNNMVATGMDCKGPECDHMRIFCCHFGHVCPIGTYGNNERCALCPRGRYGETPGLRTAECTGPCPTGKYGPNIGISRPQCWTSFSQFEGMSPNAPAQAQTGEYDPSLQMDCCVDCIAGRYSDQTGMDDFWDCKLCPMGKYGPVDGIKAHSCPSGSTKDCCIACGLGRFRPKPGGVIPADCTYCPPGTWGQTSGLYTDKCTGYCPLGKYNSRAGQTSAVACIDCPDTFTGSKAPWGEQCIHRMPTRIIWEFGEADECGSDKLTLHVEGKNKCMKDYLDYGKNHPKLNSFNGVADTMFYLTRFGYPRFCDTKTMCLNTGPFKFPFLDGQTYPIGEATLGTLTPWITDWGTKLLGVVEM